MNTEHIEEILSIPVSKAKEYGIDFSSAEYSYEVDPYDEEIVNDTETPRYP